MSTWIKGRVVLTSWKAVIKASNVRFLDRSLRPATSVPAITLTKTKTDTELLRVATLREDEIIPLSRKESATKLRQSTGCQITIRVTAIF